MDSVGKFQPKTLLQLSLIQTCINVSLSWICSEGEKNLPRNIIRLIFYNWEELLDTYITTTPQWMRLMENTRITFNSEEYLTNQTIMFIKHWNSDDYSHCPFVPQRCLFIFSYVHRQAMEVRNGNGEIGFLEEKLCIPCFCEALSTKALGRHVCSIKVITESRYKLLIIRDMQNYCELCKNAPLFSIVDADEENVDFYTDMPVQRRRSDVDVYGLLDCWHNPLNSFRKTPITWNSSKACQYMSGRRVSSSDTE